MENDAIETARRNLIKFISVSAGHFFNDFYMNLIPPILFVFQKTMSLSLTEQGVIAFIITSSGAFAQPVIGHLIDRKGKTWLLIISLVWIAFFMSISGLVTSYYLLLVVVGAGALASAVYHPLGSAVTIRVSQKSRSRNLSIFMTIGRFAAFASPVVAIPLVNRYGLRSLIYLIIPGFVVAGLMYLTKIAEVRLDHTSDDGEEPGELRELDFKTIKWLVGLIFIASTRIFILRALITYGVQFLSRKNIDLSTGGLVITLYLLVNSFGVICGGFLGDRVGEKKTFIIFNLLATLSIILSIWGSGFLLIFAFLLLGFGLGGSNTANVVLAQDIIPRRVSTATGLILGLAGGIGGFGILLFGRLADNYGLVTTLALTLIPLLLADFLSIIIPVEEKEQTVQEL